MTDQEKVKKDDLILQAIGAYDAQLEQDSTLAMKAAFQHIQDLGLWSEMKSKYPIFMIMQKNFWVKNRAHRTRRWALRTGTSSYGFVSPADAGSAGHGNPDRSGGRRQDVIAWAATSISAAGSLLPG